MKTLLATLLLLLVTCTARAQTPWPRNPKTGKVEFTGVLRWPATAKTEAQRRALVRRWYLQKLTDQSPAQVDDNSRTAVSPTLLTYAGLPIDVVIGNATPPNSGVLSYAVVLRPQPTSLIYSLTEFRFDDGVSTDRGVELEQVLASPPTADQPALIAIRRRLAAAVSGW